MRSASINSDFGARRRARLQLPSLVIGALVGVLGCVSPPVAFAAPKPKSQATITVSITAPSGVPVAVVARGPQRAVFQKQQKGSKAVSKVKVKPGRYRFSATSFVFDGAFYKVTPRGKKLNARAKGTAKTSVKVVRVPTATDLVAVATGTEEVKLGWKQTKAMRVELRRFTGTSIRSRTGGTQITTTKTATADDKSAKPGQTYTYALYTKRGKAWFGPVVATTEIAKPDSLSANYSAPPSTTIVKPGESVDAKVDGNGVVVKLRAGQAAPLPGSGYVLPITKDLPGGFLGVVSSVSDDGQSIRLAQGGLLDAFDYYDFDSETAGAAPVARRTGNDPIARASGIGCSVGLGGSDIGGKIDPDYDVITKPTRIRAVKKKIAFVNVPVGAQFVLTFGARITNRLEVEVRRSASASCSYSIDSVTRTFATTPVPLAVQMAWGPEFKGKTAFDEFKWSHSYGASIGVQVRGELSPDKRTVTATPFADLNARNAGALSGRAGELSASLGATFRAGPGVGTDLAGAMAGIKIRADAVKASLELQEGAECADLSLGWELSGGVGAKIWAWRISATEDVDIASVSGLYADPEKVFCGDSEDPDPDDPQPDPNPDPSPEPPGGNGSLDSSFGDPGANGQVRSVAVQADGKALIAGDFTQVGGQVRKGLARLNANGSLDTAFDPNVNYHVSSVAVQGNGKILIGGDFTSVGGQARNRVARLNADGTLDTSFNTDHSPDSSVLSVAVQGDGKVLIGGFFRQAGGQVRNRVARLNADGTLDTSFNPNADGAVRSVAVQGNGKILIGGDFTTVGLQARNGVASLNADGTLDTSFTDPGVNNVNNYVFVDSVAVQSDGKILIGGNFNRVGGQVRCCVARLNADGTVDTSFNPNVNSGVGALAVQADGKILIGGIFTFGEEERFGVARLNTSGTMDTTFANPNANGPVDSLAVQSDGKVLIGGAFTQVGGQLRRFAARLN